MDVPPRRPLAELTAQELDQRALEYRRMAIAARGQAVASALDRLAIRFAVLAAHREVEETARLRDTPDGEGDQSELAKLIALANRAAERKRTV